MPEVSPSNALRTDILQAMLVKGLLLLGLYLLFFGPAHRRPSGPEATADAILNTVPAGSRP